MSVKDWLIKKLGGYTEEQYTFALDRGIEWMDECKRLRGKYVFLLNIQRRFELVSNAPADTKLPTRKTKGSAGYDFYLPCDVHLEPYGDSPIILTGVKAYMPKDEVLLLFIRSSVGILKNVTLSNSVAVIDTDFVDNPENEGNIGLRLHNNSALSVDFKKGERIMQGVFVKFGTVINDVTTGERKGGTGSTGKE